MPSVTVLPERKRIPLVAETDLLVIGGGFTGVAAARAAARAGKRVLLVEAGTFLGWELARWGRPWVRWDHAGRNMLGSWLALDRVPATVKAGTAVPVHMDAMKRRLEDRLLEPGVSILYASRPTSIRSSGGKFTVTIGNKSGRQAVRARAVIDDTDNGCLDWLIRGDQSPLSVEPEEGARRRMVVRRTLEFSDVAFDWSPSYEIPSSLGADGDRVKVFPGAFDGGHVFVDMGFSVETAAGRHLRDDVRLEWIVRHWSLAIAAHLIRRIPAFRRARIGHGSLKVMTGEPPDPLWALTNGRKIGQAIVAGRSERLVIMRRTSRGGTATARGCERGVLRLKESGELTAMREYATVPEGITELPVVVDAGVLVVGGGVSGAPAAFAAGQDDRVRVALVEMNPGLGGTGTYGAVNAYWYGLKRGYARTIDRAVAKTEAGLRHSERSVACDDYTIESADKWSAEVKSHVLWSMCRQEGVDVLTECVITGTLMRGKSRRVAGVAMATPYGFGAAIGDVVVDATGDGDVAYHAGARYVYGNDRDAMTMWCSLGQYSRPGLTRGNFSGIVDVGNVFDYTRAILAGRRRGEHLHDHATYLAPRETRHIVGEVVMRMEDQMKIRRFKDAVCVAYSNHDPKGVSMTDLTRFGFLPPQFDVTIPYRALVPKGIEGLLVTGKAFSATHDALATPRMQMDLHNLGGATGLAAAMSAARHVLPRRLSIRALQDRLVRAGVLDRSWLKSRREEAPPPLVVLAAKVRSEELDLWAAQLRDEKIRAPLPTAHLFYADPARAVPALLGSYLRAKGDKRLLLARLLAWHGAPEGMAEVTGEIVRLLGEVRGGLPKRKGSMRFTGLPPDHGAMPETVCLLNALVRTASPRLIEFHREIVKRITRMKRNYLDARQGIFYYIEAVAYAAERKVDPGFVPLLEELMALPELSDPVRRSGPGSDLICERQSYLALCLARALARCGERKGLLAVAEFVRDNRGLLSRSAREELADLLGRDFGGDYGRWMKTIRRKPQRFSPTAWTRRLD